MSARRKLPHLGKGPAGVGTAEAACDLHSESYMNIDISTEHVAMRPEWHDLIGTWLEGCRRRHPDVQAIALRIRHADSDPAGEAVDLVAQARGRSLHAETRATDMSVALHDALDALERELALNEAIRPTARQLQ